MKPQGNLIIIPLILSFAVCKAQDTSFSKPLVSGESNKFNVKIGKHDKQISNTANHLFSDKNRKMPANPLPIHKRDFSFDKTVLSDIIRSSFQDNRLKKISEENLQLLVLCNVDPHGNILELFFSIPAQSTLRPLEIEELEAKIKRDLKYKLNYQIFKDYSYYTFSFNIDFRKLYAREDNAIN